MKLSLRRLWQRDPFGFTVLIAVSTLSVLILTTNMFFSHEDSFTPKLSVGNIKVPVIETTPLPENIRDFQYDPTLEAELTRRMWFLIQTHPTKKDAMLAAFNKQKVGIGIDELPGDPLCGVRELELDAHMAEAYHRRVGEMLVFLLCEPEVVEGLADPENVVRSWLILSHEWTHVEQYVANAENTRIFFRTPDHVWTTAECARVWEIEIPAYEAECRDFLAWGVPGEQRVFCGDYGTAYFPRRIYEIFVENHHPDLSECGSTWDTISKTPGTHP